MMEYDFECCLGYIVLVFNCIVLGLAFYADVMFKNMCRVVKLEEIGLD